MRTLATLLAGSAMGLLLAAGTAQAGACSGEIMALQKQLEEAPSMANNAAPLPAPGSVPQNAGSTLGAPPSASGAEIGETAHAVPNGSGETGTSGTVEQPDATGGTLVQNGNGSSPPPAATEPMDSDAASASQLNTTAGTDTNATGTDAAAQALVRARALDQAGDEAGCMNAVGEAKSHLSQ